ncbi:hypothetical protein [Halorhabdus rudnickae]|uniref:hypothetical protein n=1 Tax=Halorhabdus rudnickae TaxID=1775544 RepID=UPI001084287E|nr:hypothetical protein [Halorhabdus rudnickae]
MSNPPPLSILVAAFVLCSGCVGITDTTPDDHGQYRFVVENGYGETQNVTVTIDIHGDGPIINESRRLTPDGQWIVTTRNVSALEGGYTMVASTERTTVRDETDASGTGATLLVLGGPIVTCGGDPGCYNETVRSTGTRG